MSNINEDLFTAIDLIVGKRLEEISYDITKPYTIKEALGNGEYKVSDGSTIFLAYSENEEYKKDDEVYVLIPNGDYNETKLITGKVKRKGEYDIPYSYIKPEGSIIPLQTIESEKDDDITGLLANGPKIENKIFYKTNLDCSNYTRLLIKGSFKTELPYSTEQGHYGLKIVLTYQQNNGNEELQNTTLLLDNVNDMIGNIYNFSDYFEQSQIYDISALNKITGIEVSLYQTGDFKYEKYNNDETAETIDLPYQENGVNLPNNIFVKDVSIILGYDSSIIEGDYVELYTDNLMYGDDTSKEIKLRWIQKNSDGVYQEKSNPNTNEEIYWYRYQIGATSDGGANWEKLSDKTDSLSINIEPNIKKPNDKFKAKINITIANEDDTSNVVSYETPVLTLEHTVVVADEATMEALTKFTIIANDQRNGNYLLYNPNGSLINSNESSIVRELQIKDKDGTIYKYSNKGTNNYLIYQGYTVSNQLITNKTIRVKWTNLPEDSMMVFNTTNAPSFTIKSTYTSNKTENNISCEIVDKQTYQVGTEFRFGVAGTNGSEYTLVVTLNNNKNFLVLGNNKNNPVKINVEILDTEGKSVEFDSNSLIYTVNSRDTGAKKGDGITPVYEFETTKNNQGQQIIYINTLGLTETSGAILEVKAPASLGLVEYDLITKIPIGLASADVVSVIGATEVWYDASGFPDYYKGQYEIVQNSNIDKSGFELGNTESDRYIKQLQEIEERYTNKQISQSDYENAIKNLEFELDIAAPTLKAITIDKIDENGNESKEVVGYRLVPLSLYLTNNKIYYIMYKKDNSVQWCSPILIEQNRYSSKTLNKWDGELQVDEKGNKVLAQMFAAGVKNTSDNTFTGVVMGQDKSSSNNTIGLYGYSNGVQSFGFRENGTAFIGAEGAGRINFDGSDSIINSGNYLYSNTKDETYYNAGFAYSGTKIDLANGSIISKGFRIDESGNAYFAGDITGSNGKFSGTLDSAGGTFAGSFQVLDANSNTLFKADSPNNTVDLAGWTIDKDKIYKNNAGLVSVKVPGTGETLNENYNYNSSPIRFYAGSNTPSSAKFIVNDKGDLKASNADIGGKIEATSGYLQEIEVKSLYIGKNFVFDGDNSSYCLGGEQPANIKLGNSQLIENFNLSSYFFGKNVIDLKDSAIPFRISQFGIRNDTTKVFLGYEFTEFNSGEAQTPLGYDAWYRLYGDTKRGYLYNRYVAYPQYIANFDSTAPTYQLPLDLKLINNSSKRTISGVTYEPSIEIIVGGEGWYSNYEGNASGNFTGIRLEDGHIELKISDYTLTLTKDKISKLESLL